MTFTTILTTTKVNVAVTYIKLYTYLCPIVRSEHQSINTYLKEAAPDYGNITGWIVDI